MSVSRDQAATRVTTVPPRGVQVIVANSKSTLAPFVPDGWYWSVFGKPMSDCQAARIAPYTPG